MFEGTIEEVAAQAELLLGKLASGAICVPQPWDRRVDCLLKLPDGSIIGEMISIEEVTDRRIRATAERLQKRSDGIDVPLVNEVYSPARITPR
ncbi:MAG TPA: hypothetical protein VKI45_08075 [Allosphingosinicella sp.]|nr:hypothetical protein [Allosphingosinicella sp.]